MTQIGTISSRKMNKKEHGGMMIRYSDFYIEVDSERKELAFKHGPKFSKWRSLREKLWLLETIEVGKSIAKMKFTLYPSQELEVLGIEFKNES